MQYTSWRFRLLLLPYWQSLCKTAELIPVQNPPSRPITCFFQYHHYPAVLPLCLFSLLGVVYTGNQCKTSKHVTMEAKRLMSQGDDTIVLTSSLVNCACSELSSERFQQMSSWKMDPSTKSPASSCYSPEHHSGSYTKLKKILLLCGEHTRSISSSTFICADAASSFNYDFWWICRNSEVRNVFLWIIHPIRHRCRWFMRHTTLYLLPFEVSFVPFQSLTMCHIPEWPICPTSASLSLRTSDRASNALFSMQCLITIP